MIELTENEIRKQILDYLTKSGIFAWPDRQVSGKTYHNTKKSAGVSDILGCLSDGRILCIEVKTKEGKLSLSQFNFLNEINRRNGHAFVATSVADVQVLLNGLK